VREPAGGTVTVLPTVSRESASTASSETIAPGDHDRLPQHVREAAATAGFPQTRREQPPVGKCGRARTAAKVAPGWIPDGESEFDLRSSGPGARPISGQTKPPTAEAPGAPRRRLPECPGADEEGSLRTRRRRTSGEGGRRQRGREVEVREGRAQGPRGRIHEHSTRSVPRYWAGKRPGWFTGG